MSERPTFEEMTRATLVVLHEIYEAEGARIFWRSRIKYLDNRRPCDIEVERDFNAMNELHRRLNALADGAFS